MAGRYAGYGSTRSSGRTPSSAPVLEMERAPGGTWQLPPLAPPPRAGKRVPDIPNMAEQFRDLLKPTRGNLGRLSAYAKLAMKLAEIEPEPRQYWQTPGWSTKCDLGGAKKGPAGMAYIPADCGGIMYDDTEEIVTDEHVARVWWKPTSPAGFALTTRIDYRDKRTTVDPCGCPFPFVNPVQNGGVPELNSCGAFYVMPDVSPNSGRRPVFRQSPSPGVGLQLWPNAGASGEGVTPPPGVGALPSGSGPKTREKKPRRRAPAWSPIGPGQPGVPGLAGAGFGRTQWQQIGQVTEALDYLECLNGAIDRKKVPMRAKEGSPAFHDRPRRFSQSSHMYYTAGNPTPQEMASNVFYYSDAIDWGKAFECMIENFMEDMVIGKMSQAANREFLRHTGNRPVGLCAGGVM